MPGSKCVDSRRAEIAQLRLRVCRMLMPEEVAEILQLDKATIYRYLQGGKLVGIRLGRNWRIELEDLRKFLDSQKTKEQK